jgi:hypothetical protein
MSEMAMKEWVTIRAEGGMLWIDEGSLDEKLISYLNEDRSNYEPILEEDEVVGPLLKSLGEGLLVVKFVPSVISEPPRNSPCFGFDPGALWLEAASDLEIVEYHPEGEAE